MPAKTDRNSEFKLGGYWLGYEPGRPSVYKYWYEPGRRKIRRESLRTPNWEDAKQALIEDVAAGVSAGERSPGDASLLITLESYFTEVTDNKVSAEVARRAGELVAQFFGAHARLPDLSKARQKEFIKWCREKHEHSPGTISRNLSVVAAAIHHAETEERLTLTPKIHYGDAFISELLDLPATTPREWIPDMAGLGAFIDALSNRTHILKYVIGTLNTTARPGVILDLQADQLQPAHNLVDLNPTGRRQTKKYRPVVRITDNLQTWLDDWMTDRYFIQWGGAQVVTTKRATQRAAKEAGFPELNRYTLRHFMATYMRKRGVTQDEVALQLGHKRPDMKTTDRYTKFAPEYLDNAVAAIDAIMAELQDHTGKRLTAPTTHPQVQVLSAMQRAKRR